jgi:hypothetical protein
VVLNLKHDAVEITNPTSRLVKVRSQELGVTSGMVIKRESGQTPSSGLKSEDASDAL